MLACRVVAIIVLALPGFLEAQQQRPPQTNLTFDRTFFDTKFIREAQRPVVFGRMVDPLSVRVIFRTGEIPPKRLPRIGTVSAPPVPGQSPCGASVEMFTASVHHEPHGDFEDMGVHTYTFPRAGRIPPQPVHGVFCHPTIFVGTTAFGPPGVMFPGDVPGAGNGEWAEASLSDYPERLASTAPVTQDVLGAYVNDFSRAQGPWMIKPPGTWPLKDHVTSHMSSIFGTFNEFIVYEDCPAHWGWHPGKSIGPLILAIGDRFEWRVVLDTFFFVKCGGNQESTLDIQWLDSDHMIVGINDFFTKQTEMNSDFESSNTRAAPPRPSGELDTNWSDWVDAQPRR